VRFQEFEKGQKRSTLGAPNLCVTQGIIKMKVKSNRVEKGRQSTCFWEGGEVSKDRCHVERALQQFAGAGVQAS
jgi:hypothetical protein